MSLVTTTSRSNSLRTLLNLDLLVVMLVVVTFGLPHSLLEPLHRDRKAWQDIVKKFLTLPQLQHDLLTADIKTEDIINKYKNEKRFQFIFRFHKDIVDILRNLRVSQRPLLSLIEKNHDAMGSHQKKRWLPYPVCPETG